MHLVDLLKIRAVPAAGLYVSVTRQCPLLCSHCSTNSSISVKQQLLEEDIKRFVSTFTESDSPPKVIYLTGGEALLRPHLVSSLIKLAKQAGTKTALISGMFFAEQPKIPQPILEVIQQLNHFTASIDSFHEQHVSREKTLSALEKIQQLGIDISIQTVGLSSRDPYLKDLIEEVKTRFDKKIPILVAPIGYAGRAKNWLEMDNHLRNAEEETLPSPCSFATWPVVTFSGEIVACCNQQVVDGPAPNHLQLGNIRLATWTEVCNRLLQSSVLRGIRTFGPKYVADKFGKEKSCSGYCDTCLQLSHNLEENYQDIDEIFELRSTLFIEYYAAEAQKQYMPFSLPMYSDLLSLGYS